MPVCKLQKGCHSSEIVEILIFRNKSISNKIQTYFLGRPLNDKLCNPFLFPALPVHQKSINILCGNKFSVISWIAYEDAATEIASSSWNSAGRRWPAKDVSGWVPRTQSSRRTCTRTSCGKLQISFMALLHHDYQEFNIIHQWVKTSKNILSYWNGGPITNDFPDNRLQTLFFLYNVLKILEMIIHVISVQPTLPARPQTDQSQPAVRSPATCQTAVWPITGGR